MANRSKSGRRGQGRSGAQRGARQRSGSSDRWSWYVLFGGIALLFGFVGFRVWGSISDQPSGDGSRAAFDLPPLFDDGERIRLADLEGKPTVVNFFASWCINCERELPDFARAASEFGDDVNFVFVHTQEPSSGAGRSFARRFGLEELTVVSDVGVNRDALSRNHGARGLPMTVLYDADGTWREPVRGELNYRQLVQLMEDAGYLTG